MRVGILTYALDRPLTGIGRYTVELVRGLAALDNAPEIVLLVAGGTGPLAPLGLQQVPLLGCTLLPALLTLGNVLLPFHARRLKLDILHDPTGVTPFGFGTGGAKSVVTVYDVIPRAFPGVSTRLDSWIYRGWLPRLLPRQDAITTVSEASRGDITRFMHVAADKIHLTSAGVSSDYRPALPVDITRIRAKYGLPEHYILFVGSVEERKNLRRVVQAYTRIRAGGMPHKLVIVGPQKWHYEQIMADARAEDVIVTGFADQADLPTLYSSADVFIFPSLYEGFGLPVVEAMACGTPVITSNVSSLPEVAGDAALLVDPYDVDALANALCCVLQDDALHHDLRERGLARAARFTWTQTARDTLAVYRHILSMN